MEVTLNPNINGHSVIIRGCTREEMQALTYDHQHMTQADFSAKWKVLKKDCVLNIDTTDGKGLAGVNVSDFIPHRKKGRETIYYCYANKGYMFHNEIEPLHETSSCSLACALEQIGKPEYALVFKRPVK